MNKYAKFAALIVVVVGTLIWLATAGMKSNQTYYKTISELSLMGDHAYDTRLRVGGDVLANSVIRKAEMVEFTLVQKDEQTKKQDVLKVIYDGKDPLPDTFRDGAQALADGRMAHDGVFHANKIQAKCASKYAPKPGQAPAGLKPVTSFRKASI